LSAPAHCWPTDAQRLLLRAALLGGPDALAAWQHSMRDGDLDRLDAGSFRLLPLLYRSLERAGLRRHPLMGKLKGVYRLAWYANQLRLRDAAVVGGELARRGIEPMLLKGAALTLLHYQDHGVRPMDDVDVLVRTGQWQSAVTALGDLGWSPRVPVTPARVAASHGVEFSDARGQRIDLHWHLLPDHCWPGADDEYWEHATTSALHGVPVAVLDATDQLFHTCAHGVKWEHVPPLRWIADAAVILRDPSVEIDWERLVDLAVRRRFVLPLRDALTYLASALHVPVPPHALVTLRRERVSPAERWEYRLRTRPASRVLGRLREHWLRYRRLQRAPGRLEAIGFVRYLQLVLECDGLGALARRALFRHRWRRGAARDARARERALDRAGLP